MEFNDQALPAEFTPPEAEELQPMPDAPAPQKPGQPTDPPGRGRLKQLHTFLVKEGTDAPEDYQVFEQKLLEKPERLKQLHKYLIEDKADVPVDYKIFEEKIFEGLKKKFSHQLCSALARLLGQLRRLVAALLS